MSVGDIEKYRESLAIDQTDLDRCLMEQPEIYYLVSQAVARLVSLRDATKLSLEDCLAKVDQEVRALAVTTGEKLTEAAIQNKVRLHPTVHEFKHLYLEACSKADTYQALKEAFQQRSFMLRELVSLYIAQRHDLALEGGSGQARYELAGQNRKIAGELRRQQKS